MQNQQQPEPYLTVKQLSERLQVSTDFLYTYVLGQPDGIPAIKLGKGPRARWRIRPIDVVEWERRQLQTYSKP